MHLPAPGKRFSAAIGVDSNDITYYSSLGRGNVTVWVDVNGKEVIAPRSCVKGWRRFQSASI